MKLDQIYASYDWKDKRGVDQIKYCPLCGTQFRQEQVDQKIRPLCPNCGFIYYRNPFPTVSVLVVKNDTILLGKRLAEPGKGKWALPSGYIEFEDDFLTAAARELKEETGLDVEIISILNVQSAFLPVEYHFLTIYLLARVTGGTVISQDDLENVDWFSLSEPLPDMAFIPDIDLIRAYCNGKIESITVKRKLYSDVQ
jgi:ADP-ribose pyrophosphatase YjhB (NUDIX family)